jgi:hypothetical protein
MRRVLMLLGALAAVTSGCGGGAKQQEGGVPTPPVTDQVRQALLDALKNPALPDVSAEQRPRLPFVTVTACTGPTGGGAGRYECATSPRGRHGIRSITVNVTRDGKWSTQPVTTDARSHGHTSAVNFGLAGFGIRIPRDRDSAT